jgi:hypothetical protein
MFLRARRADVVPPAWCIMSYVFIGGAAGQATGFAVASAGDYDGDGIADVAIGAVQYDAGAPGFGKSLSVSFESDPAGPGLGWLLAADDLVELDRLSSASGVSEDGVIDLGDVAALNVTKADAQSYRLVGLAAGDATGFSIGSAGLFDGDTLGDILIGAPLADAGGLTEAGQVFLIAGADLDAAADTDGTIDLSTIHTAPGSYRFQGEGARDFAGYSVASGNFTGDASREIVIGAPEIGDSAAEHGSVYVFDRAALLAADPDSDGIVSLADIPAAGGYRIDGGSGKDHVGSVVANAGDTGDPVTGDGYDDLLITSAVEFINPFPPPPSPPPGYAFLIAGGQFDSADALDGVADGAIDLDLAPGLPGTYEFLGATGAVRDSWYASSAGDVDGDGRTDILIGTPMAGVGSGSPGLVFLVNSRDLAAFDASSGTQDGYIDLTLFQPHSGSYVFIGEASGDRAGMGLAALGDIDLDGRDDFVIGAPFGGTDDQGLVYTILGRDIAAMDANDPFGTDGFVELSVAAGPGFGSFRLGGAGARDFLGLGLGSVGNTIPAGRPGLLLGAPGNDAAGTDAGAVYLIDFRDFICFAAGTLIATPLGPRPVETLRPGEFVTTRDHGAQPLRWADARWLDAADPAARPVLIRAGAFGPGRPARDLAVSPQHRLLLEGNRVARLFGRREVLAAAVHLIGHPGIVRDPGARPVRYCHLLFDRHEIVLAEGLAAESLLRTPRSLACLTPGQRRAIAAAACGKLAHMVPARPILTPAEARRLVAQAARRPKPACEPA